MNFDTLLTHDSAKNVQKRSLRVSFWVKKVKKNAIFGLPNHEKLN